MEKITQNLAFVENSNFIRASTEAAVRGCFGINSKGKSPVIVTLQDLSIELYNNRALRQVFPIKQHFYTSGQLEVLSENILKNSCSGNYFNLARL